MIRAATLLLLLVPLGLTIHDEARLIATATAAAAEDIDKAVELPGPPSKDPFYKHCRDHLENNAPGDIIRSRKVYSPTPAGSLASPTGVATQVMFRTSDTHGNASCAITTVFEPKYKSRGPPKLLTVQMPDNNHDPNLPPSYKYVRFWDVGSGFEEPFISSGLELDFALLNGWYAVLPDHQGIDRIPFAGYVGGHCVLDSLRATLKLLGIDHYKQVETRSGHKHNTTTTTHNKTIAEMALYGYSGGGGATVWASHLSSSYAPELSIVGSAHGGDPLDLNDVGHYENGWIRSDLIYTALWAIKKVYPEVNEPLHRYGTAAFWKGMASQNNPKFVKVLNQVKHPYTDLFHIPQLRTVLRKESLLANRNPKPIPKVPFPSFLWHANPDETLPILTERTYKTQRCEAGEHIQYFEGGPEHDLGSIYGLLPALDFVIRAFKHKVNKNDNKVCGTPLNFADYMPLYTSKRVADKTFGKTFMDRYRKVVKPKNIARIMWSAIKENL